MDCDWNASKYRCLGLSGYPASSFFFLQGRPMGLPEHPDCGGEIQHLSQHGGLKIHGFSDIILKPPISLSLSLSVMLHLEVIYVDIGSKWSAPDIILTCPNDLTSNLSLSLHRRLHESSRWGHISLYLFAEHWLLQNSLWQGVDLPRVHVELSSCCVSSRTCPQLVPWKCAETGFFSNHPTPEKHIYELHRANQQIHI